MIIEEWTVSFGTILQGSLQGTILQGSLQGTILQGSLQKIDNSESQNLHEFRKLNWTRFFRGLSPH